ncbi:outer membrane transport energization protein ExbD [Jezberella montanilacus]|jgi:biopolymer transport protein ExbD|uniref:Outer membrane transport energization protein ExbD n=1 Tax=Jezberella montanilacus TaxID=323426 RepID=A0A2T0XGN6_9BURK|nr:biopolymer transporter ExbD [Jezberella montanilacus]PRY98075.1 outer membrane transport energization protein ExbD [Jezberella montanilacus]
MAMQLGSDDTDEEVINHINTTPLVDVMLVLLIIFLITIPVVTTSIPVALPKERLEARQAKPETIIISVSKSGGLFVYDREVAGIDELVEQLKGMVNKDKEEPDVQIRGDLDAEYEGIGRVMRACQRAGIAKIAFITEPPPLGG